MMGREERVVEAALAWLEAERNGNAAQLYDAEGNLPGAPRGTEGPRCGAREAPMEETCHANAWIGANCATEACGRCQGCLAKERGL